MCETKYVISGKRCKNTARWRVQVGSRKMDAQQCCPTHLSATCMAMAGAEGRAVSLTVTWLP